MVTRRAFLAGGAAIVAAPRPRRAAAGPESLAAILERSGLEDRCGFALADMDGRLIEGHRAEAGLPPASVAKIVTTLYALDALGPGYRFRTRVLGAGPVEAGGLRGDLVLEGGGDPVLDTDALGALAEALRAGGLARATGLRVAGDALPAVPRIADDQPEQAGYNPAIWGLNLNFNRVELAWEPGAAGPVLGFGAPGERFGAAVGSVRAELADGGVPRWRQEEGREVWTLPRRDLRGRGSVWLPVRAPGPYAGEVFRALARGAGVTLPEAGAGAAGGAVLAVHDSPALEPMLRDMLRYSTNLTAEVVGLRASQARGAAPAGLADSAAAMTAWARARFGLPEAVFVNHSGLSDRTRVAPAEMVRVLRQAPELDGLLRERPILDAERQPVEIAGARVVSKTGTLNFVSGLAGYLTGRRRLAFAIFVADPERRARVPPEQRDDPPGNTAWLARARAQEQALLRRWAALHA